MITNNETISKFFTLNTCVILDIIKNFDGEGITYKELKALLYLLQSIKFEENIVKITDKDKEYMNDELEMSNAYINCFISKMLKMKIFKKIANATYKVNPDVIFYGHVDDEDAGDFVKVSKYSLFHDLKNNDIQLSALDIKLFITILPDITFNKKENEFGGNTIFLDKNKKEELVKEFDITRKTLNNFIKKMKDLNMMEKMNNKVYKINTKYIVFGGELKCNLKDDEKQPIPELKVNLNFGTEQEEK